MPKQECRRARGKCRRHSRGGREEFSGFTSVHGRVSACLRICCTQGRERLSAPQLLPSRPQLPRGQAHPSICDAPLTSSVLSLRPLGLCPAPGCQVLRVLFAHHSPRSPGQSWPPVAPTARTILLNPGVWFFLGPKPWATSPHPGASLWVLRRHSDSVWTSKDTRCHPEQKQLASLTLPLIPGLTPRASRVSPLNSSQPT